MQPDWTEIAQGVGSIASAIISLLGFVFVYRQIRQTNANLKQSNHTAIYSINTELYKFFAENSDLRPYFHDGKIPSDQDLNKVLSVSELLADFFEFILVEKDSLAPEIRQPWLNYMKKIFASSPGFRKFIHVSKDQYCEELLSLFANVAPSVPETEIVCRKLANESEFYKIDKIYQECFGDSSVPTEIQKSWWMKQPQGIIALETGNMIVGSVSFWDVSYDLFDKLKSGVAKERDIVAEDLPIRSSGYVYISEAAIKQEFRNKKFSFLLLRKVILEIEARFKINKKMQILALGYSIEGEILLNKIGFTKILEADKTGDGQPLYLLKIDKNEEIMNIKKAIL